MPFYEYECRSCHYYLEVMQKITEAPLTKCPSCGKKTLVKLISAPVFRLKGGGWYETDFKSEREGKRNLAAAERQEEAKQPAEAAKSEAQSPAKATESKPEAKAPPVQGSAGSKRRASPPPRRSAGPATRVAARARGKATTPKGTAERRSKR